VLFSQFLLLIKCVGWHSSDWQIAIILLLDSTHFYSLQRQSQPRAYCKHNPCMACQDDCKGFSELQFTPSQTFLMFRRLCDAMINGNCESL